MGKYNEKREIYADLWKEFVRANPDMPLRSQFGRGIAGAKEAYRKAKNKWNDDHSDISVYLKGRINKLKGTGLELPYNNYPEKFLTSKVAKTMIISETLKFTHE